MYTLCGSCRNYGQRINARSRAFVHYHTQPEVVELRRSFRQTNINGMDHNVYRKHNSGNTIMQA